MGRERERGRDKGKSGRRKERHKNGLNVLKEKMCKKKLVRIWRE